jgi:hypothetical protein
MFIIESFFPFLNTNTVPSFLLGIFSHHVIRLKEVDKSIVAVKASIYSADTTNTQIIDRRNLPY